MLTGISNKADAEGFIAAYPDAIAPGWSNYDALFLDELVDTLKARYAVDSQRVFMTGYSAGALMTHWMACKLSDEVAAFAPVAGTMLTYDWTGCYPERRISIISFNARNDPLVPYEGSGDYIAVEEAMSNWAQRLGCDTGPDTFFSETGALRQTWARSDGMCEVVLWTTEEGGHGWPSDSSLHKLPANDEMWEFFTIHPLNPEGTGIEEKNDLPPCRLDPSNPDIFVKSASLRFNLQTREKVRLEIFDVSGRRLVTVVDAMLDSGEHSALLDITGMRSGIYFWKLTTSTFTDIQRFMIVK